jgi:hypothetical protein
MFCQKNEMQGICCTLIYEGEVGFVLLAVYHMDGSLTTRFVFFHGFI